MLPFSPRAPGWYQDLNMPGQLSAGGRPSLMAFVRPDMSPSTPLTVIHHVTICLARLSMYIFHEARRMCGISFRRHAGKRRAKNRLICRAYPLLAVIFRFFPKYCYRCESEHAAHGCPGSVYPGCLRRRFTGEVSGGRLQKTYHTNTAYGSGFLHRVLPRGSCRQDRH